MKIKLHKRDRMSKLLYVFITIMIFCVTLPVQVLAAEEPANETICPEEESITGEITGADDEVVLEETILPNEAAQTDIKDAEVRSNTEPQKVIVTFNPNDGETEDYNSFYNVNVLPGEKITEKPENPTREGYQFAGWAYVFEGDNKPLFWDFDEDTVADYNITITLWAAWEKEDKGTDADKDDKDNKEDKGTDADKDDKDNKDVSKPGNKKPSVKVYKSSSPGHP